MSQRPELIDQKLDYITWVVTLASLYLGFAFAFGPVTFGLAFAFYKLVPHITKQRIAALISCLWIGVLFYYVDSHSIYSKLFWGYSIPLAPLMVQIFKGIEVFGNVTRPRTFQEMVAEQAADIARKEAGQSKRSVRKVEKAQKRGKIMPSEGWLQLGAKIKSDVFPDEVGLRIRDGMLEMHDDLLNQHLFLLGTTGSGKTITIQQIVKEILEKTDRNVYFVDGKGDPELANVIQRLIYKYRRDESNKPFRAPMFKHGTRDDESGDVYNGFYGSLTSLYNRLLAVSGIMDATGDSAYYADIFRSIAWFVINAPSGAPRSFAQIHRRMRRKGLEEAWKLEPEEVEEIREISDNDYTGARNRVAKLKRGFGESVSERGFVIEKVKGAVFSVRVASAVDTGKAFLNLLVEDFKDVMGNRLEHPSVLIIDEFGEFDNDNITTLLALARSAKMGVVLATQDLATFSKQDNGDAVKQIVLANSNTKILMRSDFPEEMVEIAGTRLHAEIGVHLVEGAVGKEGSMRVQHTFKIDPNEARSLDAGEAFVFSRGIVTKTKIFMPDMGKFPELPEQQYILPKPEEIVLFPAPRLVHRPWMVNVEEGIVIEDDEDGNEEEEGLGGGDMFDDLLGGSDEPEKPKTTTPKAKPSDEAKPIDSLPNELEE